MSDRERLVLCGIGTRARKAYLPFLAEAAQRPGGPELAGVVDNDPDVLNEVAQRWGVPGFLTDNPAVALDHLAPDRLIISSPDDCHAEHIIAALEAETSVLVEKPMVLTNAAANTVLEAEHRSTASVIVAHNMRYLNLNYAIKQLLDEQRIGRPTAVSMSYRLRPDHGHSYFTRWHRKRKQSGGLEITKSCHHFDMIQWWLRACPQHVSGWTRRAHYGVDGGLGDPIPDDADIADEITAVIGFPGGTLARYQLTSYSPWEGFTLTVQGTGGELSTEYRTARTDGRALDDHYVIRVDPVGRPPEEHVVKRETGMHSGADARMFTALFGTDTRTTVQADTRPASAAESADAVAVGAAIAQSAATGAPVDLTAHRSSEKHARRTQ